MIVISSRSGGMQVHLLCEVCRERLTLQNCWLAFPTDEDAAEGTWVHRACIDGQVNAVFGTTCITMLRGAEAFSHLASGSQETAARDKTFE